MAVPAGMRRLTVDLSVSLRAELGASAEQDGVPAPARLRALATLWSQDPDLQARVVDVARAQQAEARERAVQSRLRTLNARAIAG
ncbi:MAG: hypothetical protein WBG57_05885 [Ornithinimicrobium sp.]